MPVTTEVAVTDATLMKMTHSRSVIEPATGHSGAMEKPLRAVHLLRLTDLAPQRAIILTTPPSRDHPSSSREA